MWTKDRQGQTMTTGNGESDDARLLTAHLGADRDQEVIAFVGRGVEFKGTITYNGSVRIDGHLDGEIHTDGILLVGEEAKITAKINAGVVISQGTITGDIVATERVRLLSPAVFSGSVKAPVLSMEEGVLFNGSCEMARGEVRELPREHMARNVAAQGKRA
ncbi:MAG: bactofilin family protein [Nitrospirales bacterium]